MIELHNLERSYPIARGRSWVLRNIKLDAIPDLGGKCKPQIEAP